MRPRIFSISMVRNEADILGQFLSHCAAFFDRVLLIDHLSVDGSSEIIHEAEGSGLPISRFVFPYRGYYQSELSITACRWAFSHGADWVVFLDADEFLEVN